MVEVSSTPTDTEIVQHTLQEAVHWMDQVRPEMKGGNYVHCFW